LDEALELGSQVFDLLRARILAREEDVFIERHWCLSLALALLPWRKALRDFPGKARMLRRWKHGTPDQWALPPAMSQAAVPSVPSRDRAEARRYTEFRRKGKAVNKRSPRLPAPRPLDRADVAVS